MNNETENVDQVIPETESFICCQVCLRLYVADSSMQGKLGYCSKCKALFVINVPELGRDDEVAIVFEDEVMPRWRFFHEGCGEMARNVCTILRLAGQPVTSEAVLAIVQSLPWSLAETASESWQAHACNSTLKAAYERASTWSEQEKLRKLLNYFTHFVPNRGGDAQHMVTDAFWGILENLVLDSPPVENPSPVPPEAPIQGFLARWFPKVLRPHRREESRS